MSEQECGGCEGGGCGAGSGCLGPTWWDRLRGVLDVEGVQGEHPDGRPIWAVIGEDVGLLVAAKQAAYGDSFGRAGEVLRVLYPDGIRPDQYGDLLTIARVLDKLFRVATDRDAFGESPWRDVAGYALLAVNRDENAALARAVGKVK